MFRGVRRVTHGLPYLYLFDHQMEGRRGQGLALALVPHKRFELDKRSVKWPKGSVRARARFRGENPPRTIEAKILSDADKLDVLGATGIARSFTIGGENGQKIYSDTPVDEYIKENLFGGKANGRIMDPSKHAWQHAKNHTFFRELHMDSELLCKSRDRLDS